MKIRNMFLVLCLIPNLVFAYDGDGELTTISFAGANFGSHPDVIQFELQGGFTNPSCNTRYAAVRKSDTHLVSALLSAKISAKKLKVVLNPTDIYFNVEGSSPNRCIAIFLVME